MGKLSLYENSKSASMFRINEIRFDFAQKIFPSWYSVVNGMRACCHYHLHQNLEIIYVSYGRIEFQVSGRQYKLTDNDILVINPFEPHSAIIPQDCNEVLYYAINIDLNSVRVIPSARLRDITNSLTNGIGAYENYFQSKEYNGLLRQTVTEILDNSSENSELYQISALLRLFAMLGTPSVLNDDGRNKRSEEFIRTVVLYIQTSPLDEVSLETAAELLSYNKAYFTTLFKKNFGMSFTDYLNQYKISIAKEYIKNGNYNLNEVAEKSGFNYYAYFFKKFKEITGITPSDFVEKCRAKNK